MADVCKNRAVVRRGKEQEAGIVLRFTEDHLWVRADGLYVQTGISDYGQAKLGEIVAVELPEVGDVLEKAEPFGEIESTSTVQELTAPVSGRVTAVNGELQEHPSLANEDPHDEGWLVEVRIADTAELDELLNSDEYEEFVAAQEEQ